VVGTERADVARIEPAGAEVALRRRLVTVIAGDLVAADAHQTLLPDRDGAIGRVDDLAFGPGREVAGRAGGGYTNSGIRQRDAAGLRRAVADPDVGRQIEPGLLRQLARQTRPGDVEALHGLEAAHRIAPAEQLGKQERRRRGRRHAQRV